MLFRIKIMRVTLIGLLAITLSLSAYSQTKSDKQDKQKVHMNIDNPYPFEVTESEGQYTILAALESDELFNKYYPFFEKHGYEGNGYCWEGHITQILEKLDEELLNHIDFDPEAGAFYAYADSKAAQIRFINLLSPIFSDLKKLEGYVKSADRDRIDD
jgi:hypothetical protein